MGADKGPGEIVAGARQAAEQFGVPVVLVGQPDAIEDPGDLEVWAATEVIDMADDPVQGSAGARTPPWSGPPRPCVTAGRRPW
jgi:fatty acid/phospholipid biosynthesis enzyme